ncbi:MAG: DUF6057 family protein [Bacteroides sp.]
MKAIVLTRYWKLNLTLLFGLVCFLFWALIYPHHLTYHEQLQLFLWDADYWWAAWSVPGGVADYLAEFLTQFFLFPWLGAAVMALLLMAIQQMAWQLARELGASDNHYLCSFIPTLLLWAHLMDESVMPCYAVALLLSLVAAWGYLTTQGKWHRTAYVLIVTPLLYWAIGSAHFVFAGWLMLYELLRNIGRKDLWSGIGIVWGVGVLAVAVPLLAVLFAPYPAYRLLCGIDYYRYPEVVPWAQLALLPLFALMPQLMAWLPKSTCRWMRGMEALLLVAGGGFLLAERCDTEKEELMRYDYFVRNRQWSKVIAQANEKAPTSPFGVTCLNLALAKQGLLAERMFAYYQNGTEGLLPTFERDYISPLPLGEAFYHIGMINSAQRVAFEAMEAIPNYKKSARAIKRLAETNLINGQYEVAAKYLRMLQKTMFYDRWADQAMACLYQEKRINAHPEWGWLRQVRYTDDYLFSEDELVDMLGLLFMHNKQNRLAYEYMMAYVMEQRDVERFMHYYPLGREVGYKHIPRHYQELLAFVWTQEHSNFQGVPWSLSSEVMNEVGEFARIYLSKKPDRQAMLQARFGHTYWYYLLYPSR